MKLYKLYVHQKSFSSADLVINPKDLPEAKIGDVVEVYHPEDEGSRLLLQITLLSDEVKSREETISIESTVAQAFNLRTFSDVIMRIVNPSAVALDSVEITFKDQYMGRSEMWRLKTYLTNTCIYMNKKVEFCDGCIRCQIYEMWSQGERVTCGVISEDTKVVFRSSTSGVYLFIQMSSEMWDFDIYGDLYFEKAVNGFLSDLFMKWKKLVSNHEVTIVLFSRTFYTAKSLEEFPDHMRDCLQKDYKGRFYEDFYRVAIQNERNDDWNTVLVQLRKLFTSYQASVLRYHDREHVYVPPAINSTAAQGNFLEVLNISLNAFEKHYLDRSFDRTGQLSVVISPGVGVFEVDRELTNITKQRVIDNGVGSDLVCVGEQPLHAVPLLKFHNKETNLAADDYSLPHWINLSFYSTNKKVAYSTFIPRIKLPPLVPTNDNENDKENSKIKFLSCNQSDYIHNSLFDYDAYDAQIFQLPPAQGTCSLQRVIRAKKTSVPSLETTSSHDWDISTTPKFSALRRKMSDPDIHFGVSGVLSTLVDSTNLSESLISEKNVRRTIIASKNPIIRPGRALINPFDPSHVTIKLTSNRRRWTHIFPKGPTGVLIQQHHYQAIPAANNYQQISDSKSFSSGFNSSEYEHTATCFSNCSDDILNDSSRRKMNILNTSATLPQTNSVSSKALTYLWGATGEQEWTPALTTVLSQKRNKKISQEESKKLEPSKTKGEVIIGVDWKSLTIPACLPITTDYFPDKRSLDNDYVISDYTLLPDDVNADFANCRAVYRKPLTTEEVFKEIVSQRLAQGFQLIVLEDNKNTSPPQAPCCGGKKQVPTSVLKIKPPTEKTMEYLLSIGRIFHKISLSGSVITVTGYRPRHPYPPIKVDYRYRFHAPQHDTYEISGANFTTEKLENFNWNFMDHYICTRGDTDYPLFDALKYWRYRMYLLPKEHLAMKKILEGGSQRCDIYTEISNEDPKQQIEEFIKFLETHLNKLKRVQCRKTRESSSTQSHLTRRRHSTSIITRAPPNQQLSSLRILSEKSLYSQSILTRAGSKPLERGRISPAAEASTITLTSEMTNSNEDNDDAFFMESKLKSTATLTEIFEAFKHPISGVGFLMSVPSLPSGTFVSLDAVNWLKNKIEGNLRDPLDILENMRKERMICHASGNWEKPIIVGFYLYYVVIQDKTSKDYTPPLGDLNAFENEWMEVEVKGYDCGETVKSSIPNFLKDKPASKNWSKDRNSIVYKHSHLEIDSTKKSDRIEWGHVKYHSIMMPGNAFEIVVQWVTASGPIVNDLISGWTRKAPMCGFQLVPIPADPLAEPFTEKSDPLRGPIFIPLNTDCLKQRDYLFEEFNEETRSERMLLFQEAILARFGFMPCVLQNKSGFQKDIPKEYQYVHCSGNMFVLIRCLTSNNVPTEFPNNSQESYVTRLVYGHTYNTNIPKKVGFLWSWNHMIANKKWKSLIINCSQEGELFQLRMLKDFKEFCSNQDQRLKNFWDKCWDMRKNSVIIENDEETN
ncbi:GATOR complex protein Iml1 isoform X2 [Condylostylus longicornis]|uniref:GATOR complex protein Iml1 isoform X2 n=1 Tax=Condylostylus longicornis TaxID=2530218 RepID=UPI00244DA7F3|nr:GATOR complex protein Iml1 isoform X2 [Condylostylus longicornis]